MTLDTLHKLVQIADGVVKVSALVIGAVWSYNLFYKRRQIVPRAQISLKCEQHRLPGNTFLLRCVATLENVGDVLIELTRGYATLELFVPCDPNFKITLKSRQDAPIGSSPELSGKQLSKLAYNDGKEICRIEPGEREEIVFDFIVERDKWRLLAVHAYLSNVKVTDREIGWTGRQVVEVESCHAFKKEQDHARERPKADEIERGNSSGDS